LRLLFDQNLSFQLVRLLADLYPGSLQVRQLNLHEADDEAIWRYAAAEGLTIVSKDSDFHQLSFLRGHPPKVVWLRIGNAATAAVAALLREHFHALQEFHADEEVAFLTLE
jgi:predicted nuclease of predicted toxin-antitoxin system